MASFTTDQKMALLVVPVLLVNILGASYASANEILSAEEEVTLRRAHSLKESGDHEAALEILAKVTEEQE